MILSFPSPLQKYKILQAVPRGRLTYYAHTVGDEFTFTPPITLKPNDFVWIDIRSGRVELVQRGGITVYRSGWAN